MFRGHIAGVFMEIGKPQINKNAVQALIADFAEECGLARFLMMEKRLAHLANGDSSLVRVVGSNECIHGFVNHTGSIAGGPADFQANVPTLVRKLDKPHSHRFRDCFKALQSLVCVGADKEGLEAWCIDRHMTPLDSVMYATALLTGHHHGARAKHLRFACEDEVRDKQNKVHVNPSSGRRVLLLSVRRESTRYGCNQSYG
jgi:hypothetical protein